MKLKEFIAQLQAIYTAYGDIPVTEECHEKHRVLETVGVKPLLEIDTKTNTQSVLIIRET